MRCFVLFTALQWSGILAVCQSAAVTPGTPPAPPDQAIAPRSFFSLNGTQFGQVGQNFLATKREIMSSCDGQVPRHNEQSAQIDFNQLFNVSCANMRPAGTAMARVELPPSPLWPNAHFRPIPTQWPDARVEQIPGTWPNLKMLPIAKQKTNSNFSE